MALGAPGKAALALLSSAACVLSGSAVAQITLSKVNDASLGSILSGGANRQFILNTSGTVTGPNVSDYVMGAMAGEILYADTLSSSSVQIQAAGITTTGGVSVNQVLCDFNGSGQGRCDVPGYVHSSTAAGSIKIGIDLSTTKLHLGGDAASVDFAISVTYL